MKNRRTRIIFSLHGSRIRLSSSLAEGSVVATVAIRSLQATERAMSHSTSQLKLSTAGQAWSVICGLGFAMTREDSLDRNYAPVNPSAKQEEGHP